MKKYLVLSSLIALTFSFAQAQVGDQSPDGASQCVDLKYNLIITSRDSRTNNEVTKLQEFLQETGFLLPDPTGYFGAQTKAAVIKYQRSVSLLDSGYVGAYTRAAIKRQSCEGVSSSTGTTGSVSKIGLVSIKAVSSAEPYVPGVNTTSVCNSGTIYIEATDLMKSATPKGCMAPSGLSCTPREFYTDEWRGTTNTTRSTFSGGDYPTGTYDTYLSYPDEPARKVGSITLRTCSSTSQTTTTKVCAYEGPVFGGSPSCTAAIEGHNYGSRCSCTPVAGANTPPALSVSNSATGPWSNTVQNTGTIYVLSTGLNKLNSPKGCMAITNTSGCSNTSSYRDLNTANDTWVDNSTLRIAVQSGTFPDGVYDGYVMYPGSTAVKAGTFTLTGGLQPKVSVSNSASGPWTGAAINSSKIYVKTTGLVKSRNPQGCASPAGSTGCLSASAYRPFTETEWGGTTDTITATIEGGTFPNGSYDGYVMYSGEAPILAGTFRIDPGQSRYEWGCTTFGGQVTPPATMCTASTEGTSQNVSGGTCYCNKISSTASPQMDLASTLSKASATGLAMSILENIGKQVSSGFTILNSLSGSGSVSASTALIPATSVNCVLVGRNLHRGDESTETTRLQKFLIDRGYLSEEASGFFGDMTIRAVKAYQRSVGLPETGMVYDFTRQAIKAETCN